MTRHFCTFFDKNYLARSLALYHSLVEHCPQFILWICCVDDASFDMLTKLGLEHVRLLKAAEVENENMRRVKPTRTPIEYSWMFGSQLPTYLLEHHPEIDMIAHLDADMYFFDSPEEIYREFGENSIMIIPHRYSPKNAWRVKTSGIYNMGMAIFRNDERGLECLHWWNARCVEWCFNRYEDGKMGDQMYLNDWPTRFKGVHVLANLGANVASWNIDSYKEELRADPTIRLIFYHFHGLKIYMAGNGRVRAYPITIYHKKIYRTYLAALQRAYDELRAIDPEWTHGTVEKLDILRFLKQYMTMTFTR